MLGGPGKTTQRLDKSGNTENCMESVTSNLSLRVGVDPLVTVNVWPKVSVPRNEVPKSVKSGEGSTLLPVGIVTVSGSAVPPSRAPRYAVSKRPAPKGFETVCASLSVLQGELSESEAIDPLIVIVFDTVKRILSYVPAGKAVVDFMFPNAAPGLAEAMSQFAEVVTKG